MYFSVTYFTNLPIEGIEKSLETELVGFLALCITRVALLGPLAGLEITEKRKAISSRPSFTFSVFTCVRAP